MVHSRQISDSVQGLHENWASYSDIQLFPVELPGHGKRIFEPLQDDIDTIVEDITATIASNVASNDDYAIYGHSLGSLFTFETYYKKAMIDRYIVN